MGLLALCSPGQLNPEGRVEQESGLLPAPPLLKISPVSCVSPLRNALTPTPFSQQPNLCLLEQGRIQLADLKS